MIVLLCGLSKSGKTTLITNAALQDLGIEHVKASKILQERCRPTSCVQSNDIGPNQVALVSWLTAAMRQRPSKILLDGHLLIETTDGPQLLPDSSLAELPLSGLIHISIAPETVSKRRRGSGLTESVQEIGLLTEIERSAARRLACRRSIPLESLHVEDPANLRLLVLGFFRMIDPA